MTAITTRALRSKRGITTFGMKALEPAAFWLDLFARAIKYVNLGKRGGVITKDIYNLLEDGRLRRKGVEIRMLPALILGVLGDSPGSIYFSSSRFDFLMHQMQHI